MKTMTPILLLAVVTSIGCGDPIDDAKNAVNTGVNNTTETTAEVKDKVEEEVVDRLDCSGLVREETRNLVTDAIEQADFGGELVVEPVEVARLIGAVAASTDTTALLVGNIGALSQVGHMAAARQGDWDSLSCDDETSETCADAITEAEQGSVTSTVACEADSPTAVMVSFTDQCTLFVTENAGNVTLRREDGAYLFEEFSIGSVRQVDGALTTSVEAGDVDRFVVSEGEGLSIASNTGKSCEERLTLTRMIAERGEGVLSVDVDAERLSDGKTFSLATPMGPATFTEATGCPCADAGSVVDVRWQGFLKGEGDANLRLNYSDSNDEDRCAAVDVEVLSWPEQCDGESTDCGKAAIESLLGPLFSATCVAR